MWRSRCWSVTSSNAICSATDIAGALQTRWRALRGWARGPGS
jgi:hypothetical protein